MSAVMAEVYMEEGVVGLEPRVARIETNVASLKDSVARLDEKVDAGFERIDERFERIDERFERIDERFERIDERFVKLDGKMNDLGKGMATIELGFELTRETQAGLHGELRDLRNSVDAKFVWIVRTMIAFGTAVLVAMMAKAFHWLQ